MRIESQGHNFDYAVMQIMQLFFAIEEDITVKSELTGQGGNYLCRALIVKDGREARGEMKMLLPEPSRLTLGNLVKKAVYLAARSLSSMPAPWGISTGIRPAKLAVKQLDGGKNDAQTLAHLQNEYWISPHKAGLALEVAKKERRFLQSQKANAVSVYIGIPFCPTRCAYCSFITESFEQNKKYARDYVRALREEIKACARLIGDMDWEIETVYIGGGTPTTLAVGELDYLLNSVREELQFEKTGEFTVEAGRPDTFSYDKLDILKKYGANRLCVNPQTMHQTTLDRIGRKHTPEDVAAAFQMAREKGFDNINADIIVGLPGENPAMLRETVDRLLALEPEAVTVHTMYIKRAARLGGEFERHRFNAGAGEMLDLAERLLRRAGYGGYYLYKQRNTLGNLENIGFSKEGFECLYNINIMEEARTVLALGAGASTKTVRGERIERIFNPKEAGDYIRRIDEIIKKKEALKSSANPQ